MYGFPIHKTGDTRIYNRYIKKCIIVIKATNKKIRDI